MPALAHLIRRFSESAFPGSVSQADLDWVASQLREPELRLWSTMQTMDKRHSIGVATRLLDSHPQSDRIEIAAALLHDVGKAESSLGILSRVGATLMGGRTIRWSAYLEHEKRGADLCRKWGIDDRICDLIEGRGDSEAVQRLRSADDL